QGQVSSIANLTVGSDQLAESMEEGNATTKPSDDAITHAAFANPIVKPFSAWLKKSAKNLSLKGNPNKG
ncbi:MAG: hypothetical protein COB34_07300, partial [Methylophilaceae bacterium]